MKNVIYFLFCWMIVPVYGQISSILPSPVTYVLSAGTYQINQALTVNPSEIHPGLLAQFKFLGETFHGLTISTDVQNGMSNKIPTASMSRSALPFLIRAMRRAIMP
jgi:hypothetical protein